MLVRAAPGHCSPAPGWRMSTAVTSHILCKYFHLDITPKTFRLYIWEYYYTATGGTMSPNIFLLILLYLYYMNIKISRVCIAAVHCAHCIKSSPLSPVHCSVVCQVARSIIEAGLETQSRTQAEFRDLGVLMTDTMRNMTPAWTRATCHVTSSCD